MNTIVNNLDPSNFYLLDNGNACLSNQQFFAFVFRRCAVFKKNPQLSVFVLWLYQFMHSTMHSDSKCSTKIYVCMHVIHVSSSIDSLHSCTLKSRYKINYGYIAFQIHFSAPLHADSQSVWLELVTLYLGAFAQ